MTNPKGYDKRFITFGGKTQSLTAWARDFNLDFDVLKARIDRLKWPLAKALSTPKRFKRKHHTAPYVKKPLVEYTPEVFEPGMPDIDHGFLTLRCPQCGKGFKEDGIRKHIALKHNRGLVKPHSNPQFIA